MKRMKRVISIILVLMLSIMLVSTFSFAENELPDNPAPGTENSEQEMTDDSELLPSDENNNNVSEDETAEEVTDSDTEDDVVENQEDTTNSATIDEPKNPDDNKKANAEAVQEEKGSERAVIEIKTIQDLNNVRNGLGKSYILMADLDLSKATSPGGIYYNKGYGWSPIGCGPIGGLANDPFTGTFDGNSHVIKGLYSRGNVKNNGLFGYNKGTIKNLTLKDCTFERSDYSDIDIGSVVGYNAGVVDNCTVTSSIKSNLDELFDTSIGGVVGTNTKEVKNCTFNGTITIESACYDEDYSVIAGGIVGDNSTSKALISRCANNGDISCTISKGESFAGGIAGNSEGTIEYVGNSGSVYSFSQGNNSYSGGVAGCNSGYIENCENRGSISADNRNEYYNVYSGGIAGCCKLKNAYDEDEDYVITLCANKGKVSAVGNYNVWVGGIAGYTGESYIIDHTSNDGDVSGVVRLNKNSNTTSCGGIVGYAEDATIQNSYNTGTIHSSNYRSGCGGIAGTLMSEELNGMIDQSYNTGSVSSPGVAGGICAYNYSIVVNCYNVGNIKGNVNAGGIIGRNEELREEWDEWFDSYSPVSSVSVVGLVYNVGKVNGEYAEGIVAFNRGMFYDTAVTISYARDSHSDSKTVSYTDMLDQATYQSFDLSKEWEMGSGPYKFPILRDVLDADVQNNIDLCKCIKMHPYGAWKTTTAPTATTAGVDSRSCYFCGLTETKTTTPTGNVTILNTIANSAKKTNDVIWDKSKIKGATNYQINWRARGASTWASRNVGNTVRGTTSGLTIGNVYEIRVRPYVNDINTSKPVYGSWSNTVYRYFHTTEKIRLTSKSKGTFIMSWKSNPNATSYQVLYTTNSNGSGAAQNIKTAGKGATSITVSDIKVNGKAQKLKSGMTYYVQVREIRNIGGTNYIGNISCPVAVKVK